MSSDQGNSNEKVSSRPVSPNPDPLAIDADIPGFEFELEENMSQISSAASVNSIRVPNFEDNRHPHVKLFVVLFALLGCFYMIYQSCRDLPREFRSVICTVIWSDECFNSDSVFNLMEYIEFSFRTALELFFPIGMIVVFFFTQLSISLVPGLAFRIRNPIPLITKFMNLVMTFHCLTNILTSVSMLPYLGTATHWSFWSEYLSVTGLGLFWMYQFLNMNTFSRLTVFNFIRARENYEMRQNAALEHVNF